jgi:hypothetical protein
MLSGGFPDRRLSTNGPQSTGRIWMGRFRTDGPLQDVLQEEHLELDRVLARVAVIFFHHRVGCLLGEKIVKGGIHLRRAERSLEGLPGETEPFGPSIVGGPEDDERRLSSIDLEIIGGPVRAKPSLR